MKHFLRPTLTAVAMAVALGMTAGVAAQTAGAAGTVDKAKASYVVGWEIASQVPPIMRDELDPKAVANAVKAALSGQKPTMSEAEAKQVHEAFMAKIQAKYQAEMTKLAAKNKAEGDAFLAKNKAAPGVKTTASGLQYQVISEGKGPKPKPTDTVKVNYKGTLLDGKVFDDSSQHGGAAEIPLQAVVPGWREGVTLMPVGSKYRFWIPGNLGYGDKVPPGAPIGPNATLVFDVELLDIVQPGAQPNAQPGK